MKNNQQRRQGKSPFKAFLGTNRRSTIVTNIFSGHFCERTLNF